jgi:hypothetical protein
MSDPRRIRLVDQGSFEAVLLESLREQQPDPNAKARVLAAVAIASVGTQAAVGAQNAQALAHGQAGSLAAKASGLAVKGSTALLAKLTGAALAVGIAAGSIALRTEPEASRAHEAAARSREALVAARHASTRSVGQPTAAGDPAAAPSTSTTAHPGPAHERTPGMGPAPRAAPPSAVGHGPSRVPTKMTRGPRLAHEVDALSNVQRSLEVASPAAALEQLDRYSHAFPQGALRAEADVLRVEVLLRAGRATEARKLAQLWLEREPAGPYAAKLRSLVARARDDASESAIELPHAGQ